LTLGHEQDWSEALAIARVSECLPHASADDLIRVLSELRPRFCSGEFLTKAWTCFSRVVAHGTPGTTIKSREEFTSAYLRSWCQFIVSAASALKYGASADLGAADFPRIIVSYHHPNYPLFAYGISRGCNGICLTYGESFWTRGMQTIDFSRARSLRDLLQVIEQGRTILCMLDYCYPRSRSMEVNFLGLVCHMPCGLLEMAHRKNLTVGVFRPSGSADLGGDIDVYEPGRYCSQELMLQAIADAMSVSILRNPERWLLWPNLNHMCSFELWPERT
jgi:hypothetical protein